MPIHPELVPLLAAMPVVDFDAVPIEQLRAMGNTPLPVNPALPVPPEVTTEVREIGGPASVLTVLIHRPAVSGPLPTVLFFHGGGWTIGSPQAVSATTERLAAYLGAVVVSSSYRLAPENPFPASFDDALYVARWVASEVGRLGGMPDAIAVGGESAGANLAAAVSLALRDEHILAGQLLINPATDLSSGREERESFRTASSPGFDRTNVDWSIRAYLGEPSSTDWRASPASAESVAGAPPAVIAIAGNDPLRDDAVAYAARLSEAGVETRTVQFDSLIHGIASQAGLVPATHEAFADICEAFLELLQWPTAD
jgi:acetyl esterase